MTGTLMPENAMLPLNIKKQQVSNNLEFFKSNSLEIYIRFPRGNVQNFKFILCIILVHVPNICPFH